MTRYALALTSLTLALTIPAGALADEPAPAQPTTATAQITGTQPELPPNPPEREFLFTTDPSLPAPGHVLVTAGMGNVTKTGEERPAGAGTVVPALGTEVGIFNRLSLFAESGVAFEQAGNPGGISSPVYFEGGAHILLTNPNSQMWRVSLRPSYLFDFDSSSTLNLMVTAAWNYKAVRVVASFMGSHTFQDGSDPVDLQGTVGATYLLPYGIRVGAEGVFEDLEELSEAGAEGGSSAYAGPTVGWEWDRFQIAAGPFFGSGPNFDGAIGGAYNFTFLFRVAAVVRI